MVETETNTIHPAAFIYQPVAAPHQAFLSTGSEVPFDKKSSFPPGEAKGQLRELVPFNVLLCSIRKWAAAPLRVAKLATPTTAVQNWKRIPLNVLHSLSQPVRADSSLREGAEAATPLAVGIGGLHHPGDGRWEQSLPQKISFKKMESPVIFSQENSPTNSAAETGSRTSMIPAA